MLLIDVVCHFAFDGACSSHLFLPKAKLRVLALECLWDLTSLSYPKLHPYKSQVARGLLAPLDDRKRAVRQVAVRVRNRWMVMES